LCGTQSLADLTGAGPSGRSTGFYARHDGGTLSRLTFDGGTVTAVSSAFRKDTTGTGNTYVAMSESFRVVGSSRVADCRVGTVTFSLNGPQFDTIALAAFFTNAASLIFLGQLVSVGTFTLLQRNAAEAVQVIGSNIPADLSMLSKANGDAAYNPNGGLACGVGVADSNGTNWKNRYTAAIY